MGQKDRTTEGSGLTRRDFLKATAATVAAGGVADFTFNAASAAAYEGDPANYDIVTTTCPYCSASCGQRVAVDKGTGKVVDIYGDMESPLNSGGLCSKGAGSLQLVANPRRIGAWNAGTYPARYEEVHGDYVGHPEGSVFEYTAASGAVAYKHVGTGIAPTSGVGQWTAVPLDDAMADIASKMVTARGTVNAAKGFNSKTAMFFGSSHMNNEGNYIYRKLIANFGTNQTEHQARI